ncbi:MULTISPECIES: DUF2813 domain-containing protein [Vibrio]|uniref:DUF2813 domain-containing protein n=2 Tax=Vibrio TaxID=662 RepID=A0A7X4RV50_9VIBR|nr:MULTISPECIES: DUF2813 domain-containing protein [Vibrio]MBF9002669.1 ATP-dependent endonuclease [Vibrio nitrifigilis]MZI93940.1 DUF2813 domain-containing protein [Vibrio eleionomae]
MHLDRIEISGFRGIRRLSLSFDELTTLIGENTWGKSSLLDALSVMLPPDGSLYQCQKKDFHLDYSLSQPRSQDLQIILCFIATNKKEPLSGRNRRLKPIWRETSQGEPRIIYRLSASLINNIVTTQYDFLDLSGRIISVHHKEKLAQELMSLHPVIRLKDSRRFARDGENGHSDHKNARMEKRIDNTCRRLMAIPGHVNKGEMRSSLAAMNILIEHYFSFKNQSRHYRSPEHNGLLYTPSNSGQTLHQMVIGVKNRQTHLLFLRLLNTYLQAKGPNDLRRCARPILIIEDPEGRLHPTHLARAWSLLAMLPMQKILTTNSSDLVSSVPLSSIRRLVRQQDKTLSLSMPTQKLSSDELRRIGFHLRFHRSGVLFARCWLLVEGETEVWLFSELARQCGYNLAAEGITIIEFAQSGLRAMIKVAQAFGIDWHVITDGDQAGKKYSATVKGMLHHDKVSHRLTELPDKDIEHFLYANGFEPFFRSLVRLPLDHPIPAKKVVTKVLKKHAKPDLALKIVNYAEQQGEQQIPRLIKVTLSRILHMANANNYM